MVKIVENPDLETGQTHKIDQGKLKIQMLIDWSISTGLLRSKEYKHICTHAQHFNNYRIEIAVENPLLKGYEQFVIKLRRMTRD